MEGYDAANTKHARRATVPGATEQWSVTGAIEQGDVLGTPAVTDGTVIMGTGYRMLALDTANGAVRWDRKLDLQVAFYSPAIHDDTVIVPGSNLQEGSNRLYGFDKTDGATTWRVELPVVSSPVIGGGLAYLSLDGSDGTILTARSIADGSEQLAVGFDPIDDGARYTPKPAVVDGTIYLPVRGLETAGRSVLLALDATDGSEQWRRPLDAPVHSAPTVADGHVYVGTSNGEAVAVDRGDGTIRWQHERTGEIVHSPCVADGMVYVVDRSGVLHALDVATGERIWTVTADSPQRTRPVVGDGTVVLSGSSILAVDASSGEPHWEYEPTNVASYSFTPPALLDGALVTASCTKADRTQRRYDNNIHVFA